METRERTQDFVIAIRPRKFVVVLVIILAILILLSLAIDVTEELTGERNLFGFRESFDLTRGPNISRFYNMLLLLIGALLLASIAQYHKNVRGAGSWMWAVMAVIFLTLALLKVTDFLSVTGLALDKLRVPWFTRGAVALPFLFILVLYFGYFVYKLPGDVRGEVLLAAAVYLTGAVVLDTFEWWNYADFMSGSLYYDVLSTLEETLEMTGVIIFIHALLRYLERYVHQVRINITGQNAKIEPYEN